MRTILLSLIVVTTLFFFSSAAPLDKANEEFNHMSSLDGPKADNSLSKKIKPPGKPPGPKLFTEAREFGFLPQIPKNIIPEMKALGENGDQKGKKHSFKMYQYFAPLNKEPKKSSLASLENISEEGRKLRSTANQNPGYVTQTLKKISAALPVNPQ